MTALSVLIPIYNGALTLRPLVHELARLEVKGGLEIILIDDGSSDESATVIKSLIHEIDVPVTALYLTRNFGEHNAVMAGLAVAKGRFIINIDDDFQNPPAEVKKLYDFACAHSEFDVVYTHYADKQHKWLRNLGSRFANWVAEWVLDKPKGLYLSSFRCINTLVRDCVVAYKGPYPYIDGLILQSTRHIGSLQVAHHPRSAGASNYTLRRLVRLWTAMFVNYSVMPLRLSGVLGFLVLVLGLLLAFGTIVERIVNATSVGWLPLMATLLVFSGVQLLMLGLIGEYLGRLICLLAAVLNTSCANSIDRHMRPHHRLRLSVLHDRH